VFSSYFLNSSNSIIQYMCALGYLSYCLFDVLTSVGFVILVYRLFVYCFLSLLSYILRVAVRRCGVVGSTLAFGSIGHGFESEHSLFSHHSASAFSKLRSLAKCSLDDSVRRLL